MSQAVIHPSIRHIPNRLPPWSMAIAAMVLVQLAGALSVPVIAHIGAAGTAWLRMVFGAVILWAVVRPDLRTLQRRDLPALVFLGTVTGFMTTFFLFAIERIPLGMAVAIEFLGPLTLAALSSKRRSALVWPALALTGVVALTEPWHGKVDLAGVGFALAAGTCWALDNFFTQHVGDRFQGITGLALTLPIAGIATLPLGLAQVIHGSLAWWILPAAASIALLTPAVAFALEMVTLRRMNHAAYGTLLALEPAIGVVVGLVVLIQLPTSLQFGGIGLVVLAGVASQRNSARFDDLAAVE